MSSIFDTFEQDPYLPSVKTDPKFFQQVYASFVYDANQAKVLVYAYLDTQETLTENAKRRAKFAAHKMKAMLRDFQLKGYDTITQMSNTLNGIAEFKIPQAKSREYKKEVEEIISLAKLREQTLLPFC